MSTCSTCIYLGHEQPGAREAVTVCRRNAPGAKGWPRIVWPEADWCGQYRPRTGAHGTCGNCKHAMARGAALECHRALPVAGDRAFQRPFPLILDDDSCAQWEQMP